MYRRRAWERFPFPDIQVGEDTRFVRAAAGRLIDLGDPALGVATVHGANTSPRAPAAPCWIAHPSEEIHRLRGEIVTGWDDDDWYAPGRLSWQVAPILAGEADLTGLVNRFVLRLPAGDFWTTQDQLHKRMFLGDITGGTVMFRRALFTAGLRYPEVGLAEDAGLIREALRRGRRIQRLENPGLFVYVRHGRNTWQFDVGRFLDPSGWREVAAPPLLSNETLQAYRSAAAESGSR